jgi:hypothetical protein
VCCYDTKPDSRSNVADRAIMLGGIVSTASRSANAVSVSRNGGRSGGEVSLYRNDAISIAAARGMPIAPATANLR